MLDIVRLNGLFLIFLNNQAYWVHHCMCLDRGPNSLKEEDLVCHRYLPCQRSWQPAGRAGYNAPGLGTCYFWHWKAKNKQYYETKCKVKHLFKIMISHVCNSLTAMLFSMYKLRESFCLYVWKVKSFIHKLWLWPKLLIW